MATGELPATSAPPQHRAGLVLLRPELPSLSTELATPSSTFALTCSATTTTRTRWGWGRGRHNGGAAIHAPEAATPERACAPKAAAGDLLHSGHGSCPARGRRRDGAGAHATSAGARKARQGRVPAGMVAAAVRGR